MSNTLFKPGAAAGLTNPMTTAGDIIYGDVGGTPLRLGNGVAGQVLQASGGTAAPAWTNPINCQNVLCNSAFDYWQAGTSATVTATGGATPTNAYLYQADQWYVRNVLGGGTVEGIITYSQATGVTNGSLFGAKVQITTAPTGTGIQNGCELWQTLSNKASASLYGQTASFTVLVKSFGNVNQIGVQFFYASTEVKANVANTIGSEILTTVNTSTFTSCTISGQALGTSQTAAGVIGVRIRITGVSSGNTYDLNNGFVVEQAMLNLGSVSAPFQRQYIDPSQELAACQYFYEVWGTSATTSRPIGLGFVTVANTTAQLMIPLKVTKRANVSVTVSAASHFQAIGSATNAAATGFSDSGCGVDAAWMSWTLSGTYALAGPVEFTFNNTAGRIFMDCRL